MNQPASDKATEMASIIELDEYETGWLPPSAMTAAEAAYLERMFAGNIKIRPPSYQTNERWEITPAGRVGLIPIKSGLTLHVRPKVPLVNLFRMLIGAYGLKEVFRSQDWVGIKSTADFYEYLILALIERIERRQRQGLYRTYILKEEERPAVVGRLSLNKMVRQPVRQGPLCVFEEHTLDNLHNQILAWTLSQIAQTGLCRQDLLIRLRRASRRLPVTLRHPSPFDWNTLTYHRLNEDYRPIHGLCRLFLELTGPTRETGPDLLPPFLIDMSFLFERFVAGWLEDHLPDGFGLHIQEHIMLDNEARRAIVADLLVYDHNGRPLCVLDTKYKIPRSVSWQDIYQVTFYAHARRCGEAILIYPAHLPRPVDGENGGVRFRAVAFPLDGDLNAGGNYFLAQLNSIFTEAK